MEIAVYGKGGIGKSTVSANLSAALAAAGKRVLQIGCDQKHDSTRLLMHGREITTVLDYIRVTGAADYRAEEILFHGFSGVGCVEAGGPAPGVGCAGRGIITAFERSVVQLTNGFHPAKRSLRSFLKLRLPVPTIHYASKTIGILFFKMSLHIAATSRICG